MKIENYKGVDIFHNATKDEFYTSLVIRKGSNGKRDEVVQAYRLQRIRDDIDKFLNTAAKKPVLKKAWLLRSSEVFEQVDVIMYSTISGGVMVRDKAGKMVSIEKDKWTESYKLYIACKENDSIIATLNKKNAEINKIKKETSCSSGKLIPLTAVHFK